ncbi:MAG: hypothetical protein RBT64_13350, partial [Trichloromonas sp.]|nr:hypothetical protein [Trichloromonas sp.]
LVYVNGSEQDFRQALALDAKCYAFVYTEIDSHIHDSKLAESVLKRTVQHWLEHLVEEIIRGIRENTALRDDMSLRMIVASDHGFLDISEQSQVRFEKGMTSFLDLERHGRLAIARIKVEEGVTDIAATTEMVRGFYDRQSAAWHVIWREQSEQYGLADSSSSEGEVVAWLMPRLLQYVSKGKGNYVHGGLSMYEAVVPVAVLTRGILEVQAPVVTLTSKLESEEEGILSIAVLNKNDQPLRHVVIHVPELGLARVQTRDIGPGSIERLDVAVTPSKSGDVAVRVICEGDIGGVRKRFEEMRVLTVQPGRLERMRLSTRRTFDEDW